MWSRSITTFIARRARAELPSIGAYPMRMVAVGPRRIASAIRWASPAPRDGTFIIQARPTFQLAPIITAGVPNARPSGMSSARTDWNTRRKPQTPGKKRVRHRRKRSGWHGLAISTIFTLLASTQMGQCADGRSLPPLTRQCMAICQQRADYCYQHMRTEREKEGCRGWGSNCKRACL